MPLSTNKEHTYNGLHSDIINVGSFEKDGSYPYVYNNQQRSIVITKFNKDFVATYDSLISSYKTVEYNKDDLIVPVVKDSITFIDMDKVIANNDTNVSVMFAMPLYKSILDGIDVNGMMLLGMQYDIEETYKFKTIGIYADYGVKGTQYGYNISMKSLQYDQDSDGNTTITELASTSKTFIPYAYDKSAITFTFTITHNDSKVQYNLATIERDDKTGNKMFDLHYELDDDDTSFDATKVERLLIMNELNKVIEYSIMNAKTFGSVLSSDEFYDQSKILVRR